VFNNHVVQGSVGATAIGNDNVSPSDSVISGSKPHFTFSNPVLQDPVGDTAVGTNVLPVTSGLEPHNTFSNQGLVDITTRGTNNLSTDICSSEAQHLFSDPVIQESVGSVTQTTDTVPISSLASDPGSCKSSD